MPILLVFDTTCANNTSGALCSWTVPSGINSVVFEVWGGGGGGAGGICNCDCGSTTQGGSGGGYSLKNVSVTPGDTYVLCAGNPGVGENGGLYGAATGSSGIAGADGGKSYVVGTNVPNSFCATGGNGGVYHGIQQCYLACGCQGAEGGIGFGGDICQIGAPPVNGMEGTTMPWGAYSMGGAAAGPGGGAGGFVGASCCGSDANANLDMHGSVPGGGGSGQRIGYPTGNPGACCGCRQTASGRGAPGLVKVTW